MRRVRLRGVVQHRARLYGRWGFDVRPDPDYASLYTLGKGAAWVSTSTDPPRRVTEGAVIIVRPGQAHRVTSHRGEPTLDARRFLADCDDDGPLQIRHGRSGRSTELVMGFLRFPQPAASPLLTALPPLLIARPGPDDVDRVRQILEQLELELDRGLAGVGVIASRLAEVVVLRIIRAWMLDDASPAESGVGLLSALRDERLARAVGAMHRQPEFAWRVDELAKRAGMSRTAFATRFVGAVGLPPLAYLRRVRMDRACALLRQSDASIAIVGQKVGFESEAAFSRAFKRVLGLGPAAYRREGRRPPHREG